MEFEEIIEKTKIYIQYLSSRVKIRSNYITKDDIYQELLNYLWEHFKNGEFKDKNITYIKKGCWFFLKNFIRKFNDKLEYSESTFNELIETTPLIQKKSLIENRVIDSIFVNNMIKSYLNTKEKEIIELSLQNLSTRDIGKITGLSHSRVIQIQKKFKKIIKNKL